jgi:hypothetical protein
MDETRFPRRITPQLADKLRNTPKKGGIRHYLAEKRESGQLSKPNSEPTSSDVANAEKVVENKTSSNEVKQLFAVEHFSKLKTGSEMQQKIEETGVAFAEISTREITESGDYSDEEAVAISSLLKKVSQQQAALTTAVDPEKTNGGQDVPLVEIQQNLEKKVAPHQIEVAMAAHSGYVAGQLRDMCGLDEDEYKKLRDIVMIPKKSDTGKRQFLLHSDGSLVSKNEITVALNKVVQDKKYVSFREKLSSKPGYVFRKELSWALVDDIEGSGHLLANLASVFATEATKKYIDSLGLDLEIVFGFLNQDLNILAMVEMDPELFETLRKAIVFGIAAARVSWMVSNLQKGLIKNDFDRFDPYGKRGHQINSVAGMTAEMIEKQGEEAVRQEIQKDTDQIENNLYAQSILLGNQEQIQTESQPTYAA